MRAAERAYVTHQSLAALFADKRWVFGAKLAYSYGAAVDDMIAKLEPALLRTPQDVPGMVRMLAGGRFDYMLAAEEEFESLCKGLDPSAGGIAAISLSDIPPGNKRYLMCSMMVDDEILRRFNDALAHLAP